MNHPRPFLAPVAINQPFLHLGNFIHSTETVASAPAAGQWRRSWCVHDNGTETGAECLCGAASIVVSGMAGLSPGDRGHRCAVVHGSQSIGQTTAVRRPRG